MIDLNDVPVSPPAPTTRAEARARLTALEDRIATIRTQIAAADMKRQQRRGMADPDWEHRARTALRHLQRERAELRAQMARLPRDKDRLKDRIIAIVREDYSDADWASVMAEARAGHDAEGG
jgi:chromosome segregation ATPase